MAGVKNKISEVRNYENSALFNLAVGRNKKCMEDLKKACVLCNDMLDATPFKEVAARNLKELLDLFENVKNQKPVLTVSDKLVLMSSKVGNCMMYPWRDDPIDQEFQNSNLFRDSSDRIGLTKNRIEWLEAKDVLQLNPSLDSPEISQDSFQDCSVVASMISIIRLQQRTQSRFSFVKSHVFPYGEWSPCGKYIVKLHFNGVDRAVEVDSRLPFEIGSTKKGLFLDSGGALWPIIVEKAYMKVMGGYNFSGSHAALDTFILTGWIPEYISIHHQDSYSALNAIWNRLARGWANNDVMVCAGTGETASGDLIAFHDYTIVNVDPIKETVEIQNPWLKSKKLEDTMLMDFQTLCRRFDYLYLNWNPNLLPYQQNHHFIWSTDNLNLCISNKVCYLGSPQYTVINSGDNDAVTYFVLKQHKTSDKDQPPFFLGLRLYDNKDTRIASANEAVESGRSQDLQAFYTTLRCTIPAKSTQLVVVTAGFDDIQDPAVKPETFTISAYSSSLLKMTRTLGKLKEKQQISGMWTREKIGGNWAEPTYSKNPQFKLVTDTDGVICRFHAVSAAKSPIALHLFYSGSKSQIKHYDHRALAVGSNKYEEKMCSTDEVSLRKGTYYLVLSSYEKFAGNFESFEVFCFSSSKVDLACNTPDYAGLLHRNLRLPWNGTNRCEIPISSLRPIEFNVTVSCESSSTYRPSLRLSVFKGHKLEASTGNFSDENRGVFLDQLNMKSGEVSVIVVERMESGHGIFNVDIYSNQTIEVYEVSNA